jgi:hypothetical protein
MMFIYLISLLFFYKSNFMAILTILLPPGSFFRRWQPKCEYQGRRASHAVQLVLSCMQARVLSGCIHMQHAKIPRHRHLILAAAPCKRAYR